MLKYEKAYDWYRCNKCGKIYGSDVMKHFNDCQYKPSFNYCPNCGEPAEMWKISGLEK